MKNVWDEHYERPKSKLAFPDENLVRLLSRIKPNNRKALDFGCGSGRHSYLLRNEGYEVTACDTAKTTIDNLKLEPSPIQWIHTPDSHLPFSPKEFGLIVSWGVFHYNKREEAKKLALLFVFLFRYRRISFRFHSGRRGHSSWTFERQNEFG